MQTIACRSVNKFIVKDMIRENTSQANILIHAVKRSSSKYVNYWLRPKTAQLYFGVCLRVNIQPIKV